MMMMRGEKRWALLLASVLAGCGPSSRPSSAFLAAVAPATSATISPAVSAIAAAPSTLPVPAPAPAAAPAPAVVAGAFRRVVFCMDGLPYRVMTDLQRQGHFASFHPASRMISTFPSLSNISWSRLLDLSPEAGYQVLYFSNQINGPVGSTAGEAFGCRFERRMHYHEDDPIAHGLDYVAPFLAGRHNLRKLVRSTADHAASETAFAYSLETDSVSHMRGRDKLERLVLDMEEELLDLSAKYRAQHGGKLEIAIVSDHGHTLTEGKTVKIDDHLARGGWRVADKIAGARDVAFRLAGILSSLALHCQPASAPDLARHVARMQGADVAVYRDGDSYRVVSDRGEGTFVHDPARDAFSWTRTAGADPLGYEGVYATLAAAGKVDQKGFALARDVFEATREHAYPNAPTRIRHGLVDLVLSPAQVLVSLKKGWESGKGFVKLAASIIGRNGTHGALAQDDSAGVFLTNFGAPTPPAITGEDLKNLVDLRDYKANPPSLEVSIEPRFDANGNRAGGEVRVHVRDDGAAASRARGETTRISVTVKRVRLLLSDKTVIGPVVSDEAALAKDGPAFVVVLPNAAAVLETKKKYSFAVRIERRDGNGTLVAREDREVELKYNGTYQNAD